MIALTTLLLAGSSAALAAILNTGGQMLDNLRALYVRICSRLAATTEAVETVLGLPLLPEPGNKANP